jgi:hypothetical protein
MKCSEDRSDNPLEWPDEDKCEECPYEPDNDYDPEEDEPTPEEMQELIDEEAELGYADDGEDYY